ncbi:hypothetical protein [Plantactinospora sp. GCM10030261]|uniref:hypothetical protein n=1 Tax=Plantactinospora sp. GCM10030261 TaxID=3273420 RepID=UPI00361E8442
MIGLVMLGSLAAALVVGVLVLVRRPADPRRVLRGSALAIMLLVVAALTPYTVDDSGTAAAYLLGVPLAAALLPVLAQRVGRLTGIADAVAAMVIVAWGLLLGLGIGGAFLPVAMLLIGSAVGPGRHARPA